MTHNLKSIRQQFKEKGVFYTPPELVEMMYSYVYTNDIQTVYDPTCGDGALLSNAPDYVKKYGQEIDKEQAEIARENLTNATIVAGDTLEKPAFMDMKFDLIMANPPFSIKWNSNGKKNDQRFKEAPTIPTNSRADYAFILHCLHMLANDGICIILNFPGIAYRWQREGKIRQWLIENNYIDRVVHIPGDTFVDTKIATILLVMKKNKKTTDVVFEDKELKKERLVSFEEIKENEFCLSVSNYIEKEEEKENIDPVELQKLARKGMIQKLEKDLLIDNQVCMFEGWNHIEFVDEIENFIKNYRESIKKEKKC